MIIVKNAAEVKEMSQACKIAAGALLAAGEAIKSGVTTSHVDAVVKKYITSHGATPSFLGYGGFPASACISINDTVIHGIPSSTVIKDGDIVSVDVGAYYKGFHGDTAYTFAVGEISPQARKLLDTTEKSLKAAIKIVKPGIRIGDISHAVQTVAEKEGYSIVRDFVGHGVGRQLHEDPQVPNFGEPGRGVRLIPGMTIAIEPMVNMGGFSVKVLDDQWTVKTVDGSLSAHFEHSVVVTNDGCKVLTKI